MNPRTSLGAVLIRGRSIRHASGWLVIATIAAAAFIGFTRPAEAKVLPYRLDVSPTKTVVGRPVTITMELDPQNFLGDQFDFEIAVYRARKLNAAGWPRRAAKPVDKVVMELLSGGHSYQGVFIAENSGRYSVVGASARPVSGGDARCLSSAAAPKWACWPNPISIQIKSARE
jgi:hypothetical protein